MPWRALPVPFCGHGLAPPPGAQALVRQLALQRFGHQLLVDLHPEDSFHQLQRTRFLTVLIVTACGSTTACGSMLLLSSLICSRPR
ncbi:MAG: hypothetical protein NTV33_03845 [Coprothermobacterota bacterium]|nr:hypothetical protein [Coprothermobacterota bacterium]